MTRPLTTSRRTYVRIAGTVLLGGLAGCSALGGSSPTVDLTLYNHSEEPYTVELTLYRSDGDTRSDARAWSSSVDVQPDAEATRAAVAEKQPYRVEYHAYRANSFLTDEDHVHYLPRDGEDDGSLTFDIQESGTLTERR